MPEVVNLCYAVSLLFTDGIRFGTSIRPNETGVPELRRDLIPLVRFIGSFAVFLERVGV